MKLRVLGEKTRSEIKHLWRRRVMNARIGDDFTSLLYIAVTSSVFLYKLPIREGGAWGWIRVRGMGYHAPTSQIMRHSNSGIKRCRRMPGIKLSTVGECAE